MTRRISLGRRLLLQRLGEVGVPGLQLREQPRVLDGDDRLVGEGLEQRDLAVGERAGPRARQTMMAPSSSPSRSIGTPSSGPEAGSTSRAPELYSGSVWAVVDVDGAPLEDARARRRCRGPA